MKILLRFALVCLPFTALSQGAIDGFMKGKKQADIALTYSYESYDRYYFGTELRHQSTTTQTLNLYATYGLHDALNLVVVVPYMWTNPETRSLQDAILALKYRGDLDRYERGELAKITSFGLSFPLGDYDPEAAQPIGQKATVFILRHLWQYKHDGGFFAHLQSGFDFRIIPESQFAIPAILRMGYGHRKFYFDLWLEGFLTPSAGVDARVNAGEGSSYLRFGGTFYCPLTPWLGAFIGGAHFITGKNIGKASRINVGTVLRLGQ